MGLEYLAIAKVNKLDAVMQVEKSYIYIPNRIE